jgi:ubiquinone/menaquinone biosynthesis C-methylase UbiE
MKNAPKIRQIRDWFFPKPIIPIKTLTAKTTPVDNYWGDHTVNSNPFKTQKESLDYLEWRFEEYPLFRELMGLWGDHSNEVVLDYGCGPGNDITGFLVHSKAKKVIGVDISEKALRLASQRLGLHKIKQVRVELVQLSDAEPKIPLEDSSVDYIYCEGVLHHTSYPERIMLEFHRILKPSGIASIMVYNKNSIWLHLYTAYEKMILQNAFPGLNLEEAFARNIDGVDCPIARCYIAEEFIELCRAANFRAEYLGGYLSNFELEILKRLKQQALADDRLENIHKVFLSNLINDKNGYPIYKGKYAGIGGVYRLIK